MIMGFRFWFCMFKGAGGGRRGCIVRGFIVVEMRGFHCQII